MPRPAHTLPLIALALGSASCGLLNSSGLGAAACPALRPGVSALSANLSANAAINGKIVAFVQAAKDMAGAAQMLEAEVTGACQRMGADLGLTPAQMQGRGGGAGAGAEGACGAVSARMDAILRGGVQIRATVQPPQCQANASAHAECAGRCDVNNDAECRASCQAHANATASCTPAQVQVQASGNVQAGAALIATLQANLPRLIHAQLAIGQRLVGDAKVVAQVGSNLPRIVGKAGAQALACIGAAADLAASASVRIDVSVRASASVSGRVGG